MARIVRCGLIQARNVLDSSHSLDEIKSAMLKKHVELIAQAAKQKVQILCLQELFYGPYFCAEQDARWYELAEHWRKDAASGDEIDIPPEAFKAPGEYRVRARWRDQTGRCGHWSSPVDVSVR